MPTLNHVVTSVRAWAGTLGVFARLGFLLSGVWLLCSFAYRPWEPLNQPLESIDRNRPPRSPGAAEELTRFFWSIGAQSEESVADLFWTPPGLPVIHVHRQEPWLLPELNWVRPGFDRDLPSWLFYASSKWDAEGVLDHLAENTIISKQDLAGARRVGYPDWEILEFVEDGSGPREIKRFQERHRKAFNPFHGLIASGVAMSILFCVPVVLGWVFKPLSDRRTRVHNSSR